jgi:histidinol dehydrogenase|tara:strand:+ start:7200 stop:8507 length:1308 start_codon:yes stop_codon:yes gene_type:complete
MRLLDYTDPKFYAKLERFIVGRSEKPEINELVGDILSDVKTRGDKALIDYTERFDGHRFKPSELRLKEEDLRAGVDGLTARQKRAMKAAIRCVADFHRNTFPKNWMGTNPQGAKVGERWYPIKRVGIYIPAGNVPLVSTVVMTTTLAKLAGVDEIAVFTPPGPDGAVDAGMRAALCLAGITEVYRVGGAQAIAAAAYGTKTIPAVDKTMGPGNAFVTEAQRQVFGRVGVDLLPGPSEALAIADKTANPEWLAADLLAQAEHGSGAEKVYYVYSNEKQRAAVELAMDQQVKTLKHRKAIEKILKTNCLGLKVSNLDQAIEVANFIAPEHLELHVAKKSIQPLVKGIRTAGAILCGHETPTVIGDFTAGPSHALPTSRSGRFFSGLKITDFMRRSSIVQYDRKSLEAAREVVAVFSELEQLDAHGRSMEIRFEKGSK